MRLWPLKKLLWNHRLFSSSSRDIALRSYQQECIQVSLKAFQERGIHRQAVSLPVGSGKTVIFSNLIKSLLIPESERSASTSDIKESRAKALVLAHREELLIQAVRQLGRWCPNLKVHLEQGSQHQCDVSQADVIVASVPTLGRKDADVKRNKYDPAQFKCIIVDEAHHAAAPSYERIFDHFQVRSNTHLLLWGCSATLSRNDDLALGSVFQEIVYHLDLERMFREGWLSPVQVYQMHTDVDLQHIRLVASDSTHTNENSVVDFDSKQLSLAINTPERNRLVVDEWYKFAWEQHRRRSTIVFALGVDHVLSLRDEFERRGVHAECLTGTTSDAVRATILEDFSAGRLPVLINCAVLTEGTDLPRTDCILLTRPTCNANLYVQMVGRGLRKHPDKDYCLVLDVKDKIPIERTLITFPTLQAAVIKSKGNDGDNEVVGEEGIQRTKKTPITLPTDHVTVHISQQLSRQQTEPPPLHTCHKLAWVKLGPLTYVCGTKQGRSFALSINRQDKDQGINNDWMANVKEIEEEDEIDDSKMIVVEEGPLYQVLEKFAEWLQDHDLYKDCVHSAYWRQRFPLTWGQERALKGIAQKLGATWNDLYNLRQWSVGQASLVLSRYFLLRKNQTSTFELDQISSWQDLISPCSSSSGGGDNALYRQRSNKKKQKKKKAELNSLAIK